MSHYHDTDGGFLLIISIILFLILFLIFSCGRSTGPDPISPQLKGPVIIVPLDPSLEESIRVIEVPGKGISIILPLSPPYGDTIGNDL